MEILVVRHSFTDLRTLGSLFINGKKECLTLEDTDRHLEANGIKLKGRTAIPLGTYNVIIDMSNRFKRLLPLIENVPNFTGVRIHTGNTDQDTEGCILVGDRFGVDRVLDSRVAFNRLFSKIEKALAAKEKITLKIIRGTI